MGSAPGKIPGQGQRPDRNTQQDNDGNYDPQPRDTRKKFLQPDQKYQMPVIKQEQPEPIQAKVAPIINGKFYSDNRPRMKAQGAKIYSQL